MRAQLLRQLLPATSTGERSCCISYYLQGQGQYWADLNKIRDEAIAYYTSKTTFKKDGSDMLVFDIDETVLSNLGPLRARSYAPQPDGVNAKPPAVRTGSAAGNRTLVAGYAGDDANLSPPLGPIRDVYLAAYDYGLSVRCLLTLRAPRQAHGLSHFACISHSACAGSCLAYARAVLVSLMYLRKLLSSTCHCSRWSQRRSRANIWVIYVGGACRWHSSPGAAKGAAR